VGGEEKKKEVASIPNWLLKESFKKNGQLSLFLAKNMPNCQKRPERPRG
jgi:hypothetical protein